MNTYIESFLELLYPEKNTCFFCDAYDESIGEKYICSECETLIKKIIPPVCSKCSKPIDYNSSTNLCPDCSSYENHFEVSKSPFAYEGLIKKGIYNFKYHNKPYFSKFFGNCLVDYMEKTNYVSFDYIVSVPLHITKMRSRGYNQSELLAKHISNKLSIPYVDALKRTKLTPKQSSQSKEARRKNLNNAFSVKENSSVNLIKNSSVLLVDDVYTTGSTADECSKALLDFGVDKVYVITIAR
ncbi:MAG: ComF family protein [Sedimentibacter sp.]|uniref:ComF family protein n=1 Tax=Sedimentibacter sp. TaxID=1960295 RepID=UPI002982B22B|nr:ComF family protein [Sedimentibacter sp.]MDW5299479.1 ComF family protein [Sedimentibacter sp.]